MRLASLVFVLAALVSGCGDAVVGGRCRDGLVSCGGSCSATCADPSDSGPGTGDETSSSSGDAGGAEGGIACTPPLVACGGACVDLMIDPDNCGVCGNVCWSGVCNGGVCRGARAGHVVLIGHDYEESSPFRASARLLTNAATLPMRNPVRVLVYGENAVPAARARVQAIFDAHGGLTGRTYALTDTWDAASFRDRLRIDDFDVALILDQSTAKTGALAPIGEGLAPTLTSYATVGGVVIALDGGSGGGEMVDFVRRAGLFPVTAEACFSPKSIDVVAPSDAIGFGVDTPYLSTTHSVGLTLDPTDKTSLAVVLDPSSGRPVVLHRVIAR